MASEAAAAAVASRQQIGVSESSFSAARPCRSGFAMESVPLCDQESIKSWNRSTYTVVFIQSV